MTARLDIIQCLRQLVELDKNRGTLTSKPAKLAALNAEIEALRQRLPTAILKHYDLRHARNEPAIAPVKGGVCGECHTSMSQNSFADLHRGGGAPGVCEHCGVFIYLDDSEVERSGNP